MVVPLPRAAWHDRFTSSRALLWLALCLVLAPSSILAQDFQSPEPITAAVIQDWPPYYIVGPDGRPAGLAVDLLDAVSARAGLVPRYRVYASFAAMQAALDSGEVDVIPNMGMIPGRDYLFTTPVGTFDISVFVRKASLNVSEPRDVRGRVAVIETNVGESLVNDLGATEVVVYHDVREGLFRLVSGDVDALIFAAPVTWALARKAGIDHQIKELSPPLTEVKRAMAVSLSRADLSTRLNRAMESFVGSPEYAAIYRRWHARPEPFWNGRRVAYLGLVVLVVVGIAGAIWRFITLRRADERIRFHAHLLDVIGEAVIAVDLEGEVLFWNRFAEKLYGWTADEAVGRPVAELTTPLSTRVEAGEIMDLLRSGKSWSGEFVVSRRDGTTFPAHVTNAPIFDEAGTVVGMVGVSTDLSTQKALEEQLRQAQKMESIGRLAGGVAHDFNNLLTVIVGTTEMGMRGLAAHDPRHKDFAEIRRAADRAAALTQQLLAFSRKQIFQPKVLDLNRLLLRADHMLRRVIGEDVTLLISPGEGIGNVKADPAQIEQIILNLAVNARDAMPGGGQLSITTANVVFDEDQARQHARMNPGAYVMLTVSDTGTGMDEATRRRAFEPFFTTKEQGQGTGLGLSTVYGIVEQSGGIVDIESAVGVGTTFKIYLPRVTDPVADAGNVPGDRSVQGTETILLVEDDLNVRRLVVQMIEGAGYEVLVADGPSDALQRAARRKGRIDLLLTDVVLPDMYGPELAQRLTAMRPDTRVLFMSGYAESAIVLHGAVDVGGRLLSKPFSIEALLQAVREAIDARPPEHSRGPHG